MTATTILILETDIEARANNARADLYAALKAWAERNDHAELMALTDSSYLTMDRMGAYMHPVTGNTQRGMVISIDKPARDASMAKAGRFAGVPADVSAMYHELLAEPTRDSLLAARLLLNRVWSDMGEDSEVAFCNVINF
jgi:hypothetical protein